MSYPRPRSRDHRHWHHRLHGGFVTNRWAGEDVIGKFTRIFFVELTSIVVGFITRTSCWCFCISGSSIVTYRMPTVAGDGTSQANKLILVAPHASIVIATATTGEVGLFVEWAEVDLLLSLELKAEEVADKGRYL